MLGDRDTYQLMAKDPTTCLENRMKTETVTRKPHFWQDQLPPS